MARKTNKTIRESKLTSRQKRRVTKQRKTQDYLDYKHFREAMKHGEKIRTDTT